MQLILSERRLFRLHLGLIGVLVGAHALVHFLRRFSGDRDVHGLWPLFNLNAENNVPSLFSALAILAAAALLFTTATAARRSGRPHFAAWCVLGVVFTWLGIDESVGLHEMLNRPVRDALQVGGPLYFAWVIPYGVLLCVLVALLWRFVFGLDALTRRRFIVAGVVYVTGALLLEMIGARIWVTEGAQSRLYYIETTAEEFLEMLGIALFIRALIAHHGREFDRAAGGRPRGPPGTPATAPVLALRTVLSKSLLAGTNRARTLRGGCMLGVAVVSVTAAAISARPVIRLQPAVVFAGR